MIVQAIYVNVSFLVATLKKNKKEQVKLIVVMYLIQ